jgi:hypothetical protein
LDGVRQGNNKIKKSYIIYIYILSGAGLYALPSEQEAGGAKEGGFRVSLREATISIHPGYDKVFYQQCAAALSGAMEFNSFLMVKSGVRFWKSKASFETGAFLNTEIPLPVLRMLRFRVSYIFNALPEYEYYSSAVQPVAMIAGRTAGVLLGAAFRFLNIYGTPLHEQAISFSTYINAIHNDRFLLGARLANFNSWQADNLGSYRLTIYTRYRLRPAIAIMNELELMQTGSGSLAATYYGVVLNTGVTFTW